MGVNDEGASRRLLSLFFVAVIACFPAAAAIAAKPLRSQNAVSLVSRHLRRGGSAALESAAEGATMGRVVAHGRELYMNTAIPGEIWALKPNYETSKWVWEHAGQVYSPDDPGAPVNPPEFPGPPAPAEPSAPAEAAAASPMGGAAPAPPPPSCAMLINEAEKTKGSKGMFLGCSEFRYYGGNVLGTSQPYGCHCASWTVNCPFETCPIGTAFDDKCLSPAAKKMGFTSLSKLSNFVSPASVPKALRPFTVHPDYISTCMYWLPKPANPGLPAVDAPKYGRVLPDFATFYFDSVTLVQCADQVATEQALETTEKSLVVALGQKDLSVISITCGSMSALVTGPQAQIDAAAAKAKHPHFCWMAFSVQVCTVVAPPVPFVPWFPPAFSPMPGPMPGPGPAPSPMMMPMLPVFTLPGAPAPVGGPGFAPAPVGGPAPAPGGVPAPAPLGGLAPGPALGGAPGGPAGGPGPAPMR